MTFLHLSWGYEKSIGASYWYNWKYLWKFNKTVMLTSKENNKALENLNKEPLEITKDRGILASYMMSFPSKTIILTIKVNSK